MNGCFWDASSTCSGRYSGLGDRSKEESKPYGGNLWALRWKRRLSQIWKDLYPSQREEAECGREFFSTEGFICYIFPANENQQQRFCIQGADVSRTEAERRVAGGRVKCAKLPACGEAGEPRERRAAGPWQALQARAGRTGTRGMPWEQKPALGKSTAGRRLPGSGTCENIRELLSQWHLCE